MRGSACLAIFRIPGRGSPCAIKFACAAGAVPVRDTRRVHLRARVDASVYEFVVVVVLRRTLFLNPVLLFLTLDAEHSHELVEHEYEGALVSAEHKVVHLLPVLAIAQILNELIDRPVVHDVRLRSILCPRGHLEVLPDWGEHAMLLENLGLGLALEAHKFVSVYEVVVRLVKVGELLIEYAEPLWHWVVIFKHLCKRLVLFFLLEKLLLKLYLLRLHHLPVTLGADICATRCIKCL